MDIVQLRNIKKQYGEKVIFQDINLNIPAGFFTVLRGESGAGKSTLLNIIGGLEAPTSGEIIVDSKDVRQLSREERTNFYRHEIGIIFQGAYLQPQFTLLENITLPGVFAGMPEAERKQRAEQLAEMLGITENLNFLPKEVSGGQAERACIARALLLSPKIILADEPTGNLDPKTSKEIMKVLESINKDLGTTIIMATHDKEIVNRMKKRVIVLDSGVLSDDHMKGSYKASESV